MEALVRYLDRTPTINCPYGNVRRVVTGGEGGVANVHVVSVTQGSEHYHEGYDEVYYVLSGSGSITIEGQASTLRPGAATVIPRGLRHSLKSDGDDPLKFIIFGTPAVAIDDDRARPRS